ncbi:hypothetical protein H112_02140 [Trichophyton rubrum D6]|uniref:Uncharacterized protein n=3 Tax=Trichophyton TaxID=5550 RepID=A0A080WIM1_TRIRC|nr:uncharacterized protein TERG_12479 [Trichophyton rubrum CBS 118892]EZF25562.1 hypothetical protein H100_02137 [Trichophyton rubrum MR850]EZF44591.1 hypothetical protein H102_02135 [Trichophyton rubrum CBS 100081]EZF55316.1 hypothetical protein H103_02144 [Trichophyton rubrum CBS 288.86]EZF65954.1 hypothetical protein H104_02120 [Trichophyton rubrum CBS 289.86]EZF76512.1 hypothetical protein H105_02152 [Trichophyton soudanense CBS 452.61]EZF87232.1 hypothetical protein H110_02140 [Trichophy
MKLSTLASNKAQIILPSESKRMKTYKLCMCSKDNVHHSASTIQLCEVLVRRTLGSRIWGQEELNYSCHSNTNLMKEVASSNAGQVRSPLVTWQARKHMYPVLLARRLFRLSDT